MKYSKPRIIRIQVDRQIYPSYAKIRLTRSEIKRFEGNDCNRNFIRDMRRSYLCEVYFIRINLVCSFTLALAVDLIMGLTHKTRLCIKKMDSLQ